MAQNVRFIKTTKPKYIKRDTYDPTALYFCEDTGEIFKGQILFTEGVKIIPTRDALPSFECAADGVVYYIEDTKAGFMLAPTRDAWLQTIYAPVADVTTIPEGEEYNVVTTVGAVRDIENAIYAYIDQEIANVEISGSQGKDGLSAYEIWLNDGHSGSESDFLNWLKGKDGYTPVKGVDYFDGVDGKDGENGKDGAPGRDGVDGKSAYEIWLDTGHSGSEDDFLQWLKGDTEPFGDVVTSIGFDGIAAGTSLKGKTVKDVLVMLLGVQAPPQPAVQVIMTNRIPAYSGTENTGDAEVVYAELDTATADYHDEGFYVTKDDSGNITNAGYQVAFEGNSEMDAQTFAVPSNAKIVGAYQYDEFGTKTWLEYEFPGSYWVEGDMINETVNGQNITYQTYSYDVDSVGDAITTSEYWRFEIEV